MDIDCSLIAEKLDHWAATTREFQRVQKEVKAEIMSCYDEKKTDLYLSGRILSSLPDVFDHLTQLRKVVLTNNFLLEELPGEVLELSHLEHLYLGNTSIETLPEEITKLSALKR